MGRFDNPRGPRDFYSGRLNESDVLGDFKPTKEGLKAFRAEANEKGYIASPRAIELVREHTQEDPTNPGKPFANELRLAVIEELGLEDEADMDRIRFYSAVGTPLDVFHGVDGWIEFVPDKGSPRMVTIDVTLNSEKLSHKADIIVQEVPDPAENEKRFLELVYNEYAPQVAEQLRGAVQMMMRRREREQQSRSSAAK